MCACVFRVSPLGEHNPGVQPERALPEVQEAQQDQRRQQAGPVPVPAGARGGGARAGGRGGGGGGARIQEGQIGDVWGPPPWSELDAPPPPSLPPPLHR